MALGRTPAISGITIACSLLGRGTTDQLLYVHREIFESAASTCSEYLDWIKTSSQINTDFSFNEDNITILKLWQQIWSLCRPPNESEGYYDLEYETYYAEVYKDFRRAYDNLEAWIEKPSRAQVPIILSFRHGT